MNKKLRYGSAAVIFTIAVVALVVLVNVVFTALSNAGFWYTDMTQYDLYSLTDESRELLDQVDPDRRFTIYFCTPLDRILDTSPTNGSYNYMLRMVYEFAQQYPAAYPNISLEYLDIITNPSSAERFRSSSTSAVSTTSVIVSSENDFRLFTLESLFGKSEDGTEYLTFNAETKLTSAILQLAGDQPRAYFTVGHGEITGSEGQRPAIWGLLVNAGYLVDTIDLSQTDIPSDAKLLIINGPRYDFRGFGDAVDEVSKIGAFTDSLGSLMVFFSPDMPERLPELEGMLAEWGVRVENAVVKDFSNSESTDGYTLVASYTEDGLGASLTKSIRALDSTPKAIVRYARPISILWPDGERTTDTIAVRSASAILTSYPTARAYDFGSNEASEEGKFNLLTITREMSIVDNNYYYSYVLVCGTTDFASDDYLYKSAFSNGDILYAAMRAMGKETVPFRLSYKWFEDTSLDVTSSAANAWTVVLCAVIPSLFLIAGAIVSIRRKRL